MTVDADRDAEFEDILEFIRLERGFDFTGYKRPSLRRRIDKRMQHRGLDDYAAYRSLLAHEPDEFVDLFNTILINVTSFFRDPDAWDYVAAEIVPRILQERGGGDLVRVWSTGCASGEEAFTIAMILAEAMGEDAFRRRVKIYATDIDDEALNVGRHATYSAKQVEPLPDGYREKYFERVDGTFVFRSELRRSVIFGRHDLVADPPISRIDLLTSRNTLMYFVGDAQARILESFHFALRDDGFLFLGRAEALAARSSLFAAIDVKRRVFAKVPTRTPFSRYPRLAQQREREVPDTVAASLRAASMDAAPIAQVAVNRDGTLVLVNLQARLLFGLAQRDVGRPLQDLEISFRPVELRSRIEQAYVERHPVALREVEWTTGNETRFFDVHVAPLTDAAGDLVGATITYTDATRTRRVQEALQEATREADRAYEELHSTVEELETTNEELQAMNEELETTNEELQATNEELETTNEELHSTNEELETLNDELHQRGVDLDAMNHFLESVLTSLRAGVVVVDRELQVHAWNHGARELWGLTPDETLGRHLSNLDIGLPIEPLRAPIRRVTSGEADGEGVIVAATNRRGRAIECHVAITALHDGSGHNGGAILMMQEAESGA